MLPRAIFATTLLLAGSAAIGAQPLPPLPLRGPSPLLFVKLVGPAGMHAVVYQGRARPRDLAAPVQLGLRPGYIYRLELNGFAGHPNISLFPTLEVRGSLSLPPGLNPAAFPAAVVITEDDLRDIQFGAVVTKVIYLENPELATPATTTPDQPLETSLPPDRDPIAEAREHGRPVLILRFGQKQLTPQEVALSSVPGTVLFPDERTLGQPAAPPMLPWACFPWYDPRIGPRPPEEECIHNGCINPPNPRFVQNGRPLLPGLDDEGNLQGLNPEDAVAEFRDSHGGKHLTASNRVCLCVPRFGVLRSEIGVGHIERVVTTENNREVRPQEQVRERIPTLQNVQVEQARVLAERARASALVQVVRTEVAGRVQGGPEVLIARAEIRDLTAVCVEAPHPPEKPLVVCKSADKQAAQPGEVVTFTLKYSNHGGLPITDIGVVDSLSGRLEYIPGSAQSDRDAVFTSQPNEAGSAMLRWEVSGKLLPGESGIIRFQARVR